MRCNQTLILFVVVFSLPIWIVLPPTQPISSYSGPLFDAHSHVLMTSSGGGRSGVERGGGRGRPLRRGRRRTRARASEGANPSSLNPVHLLRRAGFKGVFLFGSSDRLALEHASNPDFVYPFVGLPRDRASGRLCLDEEAVRLVERELMSGRVRGIGEISLRHVPTRRNPSGDANPADGPIPRRLYDLAARYKVPVTVHVEHAYSDELERALAYNRKAVIIWAHVGDSQPRLVRGMMKRHPNLYADISCRNPLFKRLPIEEQSLTNGSGSIKAEWGALFEEFPGRFLFGLDLGAPDRARLLDQLVSYYRSVLGQLTPQTAERIAYRNAMKLAGGM